MSAHRINVVGAGLAGSLVAIYLARAGYSVHIYEKRSDPRRARSNSARALNLVISKGSIRLLDEAGLSGHIREVALPLKGRMMHSRSGDLRFQAYGKQAGGMPSLLTPEEGGNSMPRAALNALLVQAAENLHGVEVLFEHRVADCDLETGILTVLDPQGRQMTISGDVVIGADGTFSAIRQRMAQLPMFTLHQPRLEYGYKELHIPPGPDGGFLMEKHALHIWPRAGFIMSALPNFGGSFNGNLFLPLSGANSFESLARDADVARFFAENFPDLISLVPRLSAEFLEHSVNPLVAVRCWPWHSTRAVLLGDACHTMYPFSGLGANLALEDCAVLAECIREFSPDWGQAFLAYSTRRRSVIEGLFDASVIVTPLLLACLPEDGVTGKL